MQREQWGLLNTKLIQTIITILFCIVKTAVDTQFFFPAPHFVNYFCRPSAPRYRFMGGDLSGWSLMVSSNMVVTTWLCSIL